jgi:hypothetical protein
MYSSKKARQVTTTRIGYTRRGSVYSVCEVKHGQIPPFREPRSKPHNQQVLEPFVEPIQGRTTAYKLCSFHYRDGSRVSSKDPIHTPPSKYSGGY